MAILCGHEISNKNHLRNVKVTELHFAPDGSIPDRSVHALMFLGIDIGTSGVKAVVIDPAGSVAGQGIAARI